jgi:acetyltransferase-like isoleucine patch superfamily enzyme
MEQILIGDDCLFGPNVVIVAANHNTYPRGSLIRNSGFVVGKIIIGNGCWIGANVTITSGVIIGNGSVIGANSVVTHNIPPYVIAAGTPAKIIRSREGKNIVLSCKVE